MRDVSSGTRVVTSLLPTCDFPLFAPWTGLRARDAGVDETQGAEGCRDRHPRSRAHVPPPPPVSWGPREGKANDLTMPTFLYQVCSRHVDGTHILRSL